MARKTSVVQLDFDDVTARFQIGEDILSEETHLQVDLLKDLKASVQSAYEAAQDRHRPGARLKKQQEENQQRRLQALAIVGKTIVSASPLRNGDVALQFSDGSTIVMCSTTDAVQIKVADSLKFAQDYAEQSFKSSLFVDEPASTAIPTV